MPAAADAAATGIAAQTFTAAVWLPDVAPELPVFDEPFEAVPPGLVAAAHPASAIVDSTNVAVSSAKDFTVCSLVALRS
jgi:hypothetical protein